MNLDFFLGILNALNCGDVLNEVAYAVRPYEVNAGETDQKLDEAMDYMHEVFRKKHPWQLGDSLTNTWAASRTPRSISANSSIS